MSTELYVRLFTNIHNAEKKYAPAMAVCTVCGNDTPLVSAIDVSDDSDAVVYVGAECIMGWFAWQELQSARSYVEMLAAIFAQEELIQASADTARWQSK